ncbi:hypothetical protein BDV93DRAFT_554771 [Ceratobasidium sp. AG-I]|nr:hypothetical protein BDV93DRAFT_554771 [Ceratobasidium sp. AG-I]
MAHPGPVLPSERELELETLLRQRDTQISSLTDEISTLRRKLPGASDPADDAAICIPPPVLALLAPLIAHGPSTSSSAPLASAISQRIKLLQAENDELYELLRVSEAARAREEVVGLRKVVKRLEGLLADAEVKISDLSSKVDLTRAPPVQKSLTSVQQQPARRSSTPDQRRSASPSRRTSRPRERSREHDRERDRDRDWDRDRDRDRERDRERGADRGNLPTGPRAHKKPRLSATNTTPVEANRKPEGGQPGAGGAGGRNGSDGGGAGRNVSGRNNGSGGGGGGAARGGGPPRGGAGLPIRGSATASAQNGNPSGQSGDRGLVQRLGL